MHHEYELKLALTPEQLQKLSRHALLQSLARGKTASRRLVSTYFDTPAGMLRKRAIALRVRQAGRQRTQTVKVPGNSLSGLQHFEEHEVQIDGDRPQLDRIDDPALRELFETSNLADQIGPVFKTDFARRKYLLRLADSEIELALDHGEIRSGSQTEPICEAELELVSGRPARIFELALALQESIPFRLEARTKARRGFDLAMNVTPEPVRATDPGLSPSMSVTSAFTAIAHKCCEQIRANEGAVMAAVDPEGVHQMRVGIRRLRAAIQTFRPVLDPETHAFLEEELGWLQKALGPARDWDVFLTETLPGVEQRVPDEHCFEGLREAVQRTQRSAYEAAHAAIQAPRYARLLLRLNLELEEGSLFTRLPAASDGQGGPGIMDFAASVLAKRHKKVLKAGRGHDGLSTQELHRLRIEAKKLRYAAEFFRGLYPAKKAKRFVKSLAAIQDALGAVNDARVTRGLLGELRIAATSAPSYNKALTERSVGLVLGWQAARLDSRLRGFRNIWNVYVEAARYWT